MNIAFLIAATVMEITPGPNMTYLSIVAASQGQRHGFATVAGIATGLALIGCAAAFGVAELVQTTPALYEILRWGGVAFIIWLAWDGWRQSDDPLQAGAQTTALVYFRRGLVTNLLNPKAALFYVSALPGFTDPTQPLLPQTLSLTALYVTIATVIHVLLVLLASQLSPLLNHPQRAQKIRRALSALLLLVALWVAMSTAQTPPAPQ